MFKPPRRHRDLSTPLTHIKTDDDVHPNQVTDWKTPLLDTCRGAACHVSRGEVADVEIGDELAIRVGNCEIALTDAHQGGQMTDRACQQFERLTTSAQSSFRQERTPPRA